MVWSFHKTDPVWTFDHHQGSVSHCAWSPSGVNSQNPNANVILATSSYDKTVKLWDVETGKMMKSLEAHDGPVMKVAFSPDFRYLASGANDGSISLWSMRDQQLVKKFKMKPAD